VLEMLAVPPLNAAGSPVGSPSITNCTLPLAVA
jgi:hypothetical protein